MPLFSRSGRSVLGRTVGTGIKAVRLLFRGSVSGGRWMTRRAGRARARGAGGEVGMVRLFDLHALSCAGDTLIAIGLAGTIFFNVPLGEARSKVALYLLVTMVPFAMLAPVVGPLLDHFRHGRRYALAATMLGRAFLAWLISDYIHGFGLYPAAFGVLALSRAYGVARSAAVPRLLPEGLGLSQVGARASVYGTVAGALVAPIGLAAFWFGPQWPLRVASIIFLVGMVISLRLPPRADSEPPERVPRPLRALGRRSGDRPLGRGRPAGRLVIATLIGAATLRGLYGFLLLFLAFAIKAGDLTTVVFGRDLGDEGALGLVGAALAVGTFLATAIGTRLRIHRPVAIQSSGMIIVGGVAVLAALMFSLPMVALLCLVAALVSGIAKLAVDASIQERIPERLRASSFAHSETVLMLAFVAGGGLGLVPFDGRIGIAVAAGVGTLAAVRGVVVAGRLRAERLAGRPLADDELTDDAGGDDGSGGNGARDTAGAHTGTADATGTGSGAGARPEAEAGPETGVAPVSPAPAQGGRPLDDPSLAPPGYHIYRPSSAVAGTGGTDDETRREPQGPLP
ncbi:MFS transporter [Micromonospora sp. SD12]|uniref:MFS transporter n=1 Tax=Micromonospora sp. SD12 TaxID=3452216 RepID=UPI003F89D96F